MTDNIISSKSNVITFKDMAHDKSGDYYNKQKNRMDCLVYLEKVNKFAKIGSYKNNLKNEEQKRVSQLIWNKAIKDI